jgi:hypothetical protein
MSLFSSPLIKSSVEAIQDLIHNFNSDPSVESRLEIDLLVKELMSLPSVLQVNLSTFGVTSPPTIFTSCSLFSWGDALFCDTQSECWIKMSANPLSSKGNSKGVTWSNFKSSFSALLTGEAISKDRQEKRLAICHKCELFRWDSETARASCGICGCKLGGGSTKLLDLTIYEETAKYGCKHPTGSRWKENGC